jgi:dTDP-4-amino-4,6-dideoxygalactose transaminase
MSSFRARSPFHREVEALERAIHNVRNAESVVQPLQFVNPGISDEDIHAVMRVLRSGWLTTGFECRVFEEELSGYLGAHYAVATSSGTAALEVALRCLDLPRGARVAIPSWTFVATMTAVLAAGLAPVLVDVDPDSLNVAPHALEAALGSGIDAVVLVHFAGVPVAREVHELCARADVPVVEDAAHALGAVDHRGLIRGAGCIAACFSFGSTGNITAGEGGALVTDRADVAARAAALRLHGLTRDAWARFHPDEPARYGLLEPGAKANLPDLLAALGRSQLARLEDRQERRRRLVIEYRKQLAVIPGVRAVPEHLAVDGSDHLLVVVLPAGADRDGIQQRLREEGVPTAVHFPPLHHFDWFRAHAEIGRGGLAVADAHADRVLSLPLHAEMTLSDVERVATTLRGAVAGAPATA